MRFFIHLLSVLATASAVVAAPNPHPDQNLLKRHYAAPPKVIYFQTNDPTQNTIVALKVNHNGLLSDGSVTPTGGKGASGADSMTNNTAAGPDALFSQSAVKVAGNYLVAVNAGSNTLSLFSISPHDPTALTPIGQPVDTMGEFPVTASISLKNQIACVGNSGAKAGIACFTIHHRKGLAPIAKSAIAFPINQTTPPVGPLNSVSHVLFNEDETMLVTTVKGDPTQNITGFLSLLPVSKHDTASQDTRSSPNGTLVLFGAAIAPNNTLFSTDAAFGAASISLPTSSSSQQQPAVLHTTTIANQTATCWTTISPFTHTAFVTDVARDNIVEIDYTSGKLLQQTNLNQGNQGYIDLVAGGKFVYALSPGTMKDGEAKKAKVVVLDVGARPARVVQSFGVEAGRASQGMAAFM
ncbi:MAG: hypothetical protein Q9168_007689 [Polycauliona sp. 1 TL-2023]